MKINPIMQSKNDTNNFCSPSKKEFKNAIPDPEFRIPEKPVPGILFHFSMNHGRETIFSGKNRIPGTGFSESGIPDPECHF